MKGKYIWFILPILSLILVACNEAESEPVVEEKVEEKAEEVEEEVEKDIEKDAEEDIEEVVLLSDEEIKEIVINNLDQMEESVGVGENYDESMMQIVDETIVDPEQDTEEVAALVANTKEKFEHLVSEEFIDEWTREYLSIFYWTMHNDHLNSGDIHTRFAVEDQTEETFEVSFLTLADEAGFSIGGTYHLHYVKENDHWKLRAVDFINTDEKPLNLTFEDLEEYYNNLGEIYNMEGYEMSFKPLEEIEVGGATYLVYEANDYYNARNTIDSEYNYEVAQSYQPQN